MKNILIFLFPYINNYEQSGNESRTHSNIPSQSVQYLIGYLVFVNIVRAIEMLASELLDLAVYHANRTTKVSRVWEQFTSDLEKMEDPNG